MRHISAAIINEEGETLVLAHVKKMVLDSTGARKYAVREIESLFGMPVVLVSYDSSGNVRVWGRREHLRFLSTCDFSRFPWKDYEFPDKDHKVSYNDWKPDREVCTACGGTGKRVCPVCDRRGDQSYLGSRGVAVTCDVCFGKRYLTCKGCDGRGYR